MRLATGRTELVLTIDGYQFPEIATDDWLIIRLDVRTRHKRWTSVDPGLLAGEVEALASWLRELAGAAPITRLEMGFVEPFLHFQVVPKKRTLRVKADYGRFCMAVPADAEMLAECAAALRSQLRQYPRRTERRREDLAPPGPSGPIT